MAQRILPWWLCLACLGLSFSLLLCLDLCLCLLFRCKRNRRAGEEAWSQTIRIAHRRCTELPTYVSSRVGVRWWRLGVDVIRVRD